MGKNKMTLKEAKIEYNPRKIFDILINDKPYTVYDIEGYEHEYGKWNGCPTTWWLDYSEYEEYVEIRKRFSERLLENVAKFKEKVKELNFEEKDVRVHI